MRDLDTAHRVIDLLVALRESIAGKGTIYRCGWCGMPVEADGSPLSDDIRAEYPHPDQYIAAHPDAHVVLVYGFCCPAGEPSADA